MSVPYLDPVDLVLAVSAADTAGEYRVKVTYRLPGGDAEVAGVAQRAPVRIDRATLAAAWQRPDDYATLLSAAVFADADLRNDLDSIRRRAREQPEPVPVRLRLQLDEGAADLQELRWELLRDPAEGQSLATGERVWLSRYLSTRDPVALGELKAGNLRSVLVVASPTDAKSLKLAPVDVAGQVERARVALKPVSRPSVLARLDGGSADGVPTLAALVEQLRTGVDLLVVVAHGRLVDGEPLLYLEGDDGSADKVSGADLVARIDELPRPPRLVVLVSCQSGKAARNRDGVLSALGPRLAAAGVPAVVAMQGDVSIATADRLTTRFFAELAAHGQIDRALSVARGEVRDEPDAWMPALFMRLTNGLLWGRPRVGGQVEPFDDHWPVLVQRIREGSLTPVLGAGLLDSLLGSPRDIAQAWATTYDFPLELDPRSDLPQVTQYVAVKLKDEAFPRVLLRRFLQEALLQKYADALRRADPAAAVDDLELADLVAAVGRLRRTGEPDEVHSILAGLPIRQYITTNPDRFLDAAIADTVLDGAPRVPHVELCHWNDDMEWTSAWKDPTNPYRPSIKEPLVFHLFGDFATDHSIVLTEDDHFDFLVGLGRRAADIPPPVLKAIKDDALLFLGFRLDSWAFRVLFRSFIGAASGGRRRPHFAVQVDPTDPTGPDPAGAREYLSRYLEQVDVSIFWGSVEELLVGLRDRLA